MNIRTMVESDLDDILALLANQSINTATVERFAEYLESGAYRHEWTWVAEDGDRILALAVWWGMEGDDLLGEITHVLAEVIQRGEVKGDRIRADTDLTNKPMAAAFERAGYRNFAVQMVASYPLS